MQHATYSMAINCAAQELTWGLVKGRKKIYARNYGHVLKNGKGMTLIEAALNTSEENRKKTMGEVIYGIL